MVPAIPTTVQGLGEGGVFWLGEIFCALEHSFLLHPSPDGEKAGRAAVLPVHITKI